MKDRNGIEVRVGDRVLVLVSLFRRGEPSNFGMICDTNSTCNCSECNGRQIARVRMSRRRLQVRPEDMELPVAAAIARSRD